ncbi:MAG: 16S rRNA (cytosine(967)-C(5))-methyltransferase RsmB [Verrucomicrobia bacterium]|nr:16S rRNA (cytosine(967)-C(5))-methyltransferase RsmB [Verrucomicrobiota bacterium]
MNAREVALELLERWPHARRLADELLDEQLAKAALSGPDRALATELFYGCLRQKMALEFLVSKLAAKAPRTVVGNLLKLGLYQLFFLKTAPHAAVNETVALAKQRSSAAEAKFVNAILRTADRNNATYVALLRSTRETEPWVFWSHPQWLWERWAARWGQEMTEKLCAWNNQPPPVYVRGSQPWPDVLEPTTLHPLCYRVIDAPKFFANPGRYYVQDPSTLVAVDLLDPQPGESVLDLCAAPGGKTTYAAQRMENRGRIVAMDVSASRLGRVGENCRRLGVTIVATLACSGTKPEQCLRGEMFDRVLVDAPCSNTGVMRRRPDLRWRLTEAEIGRLAFVQEKLLASGARLTRRGGVLVYGTCSLEMEENERVAERFRDSHPEFALDATRSTFPPRDGQDATFVARFRRL